MTNSANDFMETLRAIVPLQSATKAIYYYSVGLPSSAVTLTKNLKIEPTTTSHQELARRVELLLKKASSMRDTASASVTEALQGGNQSQTPYSDILAAVESGNVSIPVVDAIVALFAKNGIK